MAVATIGLSKLVVGTFPTITAIIQNAGRTPAANVRAPGKISLNLAGQRPESETIQSHFRVQEAILGAGATHTAVYEFKEPCDNTMKYRIENGILTVFIQGTIWYDDAWGIEQHTSFFFEWNPAMEAFMDRREREHGDANQAISD